MDTSHPLDPFFFVPIDGLRFLGFECVIGIFASLIISIASSVFLFLNPSCTTCDLIMSTWLSLIATLRLVDLPIKAKVIYKIYTLSKRINHEDRRFMIRRLMDLVRSPLYFSQSVLNGFSFIVVFLGMIKMTAESSCEDQHFYQFCSSVIMTFWVRLIVGAANFKYEERKVINRGMGEFTQFYKHGATLHDIESVKLIEVTKENLENLKDLCAICTEEFRERDMVRMLRCSDSHNFHQDCIDRWLIQKDACPLCGVSVKTAKVK